ncbi:MAG: DUF433 domain-containing protein [Nitrospira sp.]|nr:DUF433 domain-containing protein [Nitrospira sp.]
MKPDLLQRITIEPGKCGGRPCIRGLRVRVQDILDMLAAGASKEKILRDYPYLERDDIRAAITSPLHTWTIRSCRHKPHDISRGRRLPARSRWLAARTRTRCHSHPRSPWRSARRSRHL